MLFRLTWWGVLVLVAGCGFTDPKTWVPGSRSCRQIVAYPYDAERDCYLQDRPALIECVRRQAEPSTNTPCWLSPDGSLVTLRPPVSSTALDEADWQSCGLEPPTCASLE